MIRFALPLTLLSLVLVVLPATTACSHVKTPAIAFNDDGDFLPKDVGEGLVVSPNPLIPDVPMPVGFKAVASQSNWRYDGRVRVVNHVYQGHAKPSDAVEFYQRNLPSHNWSLVDMEAVGESTVLRYTKGQERLKVTTKDGWSVSTVTINIEPR